ncbi:Dual-specificity kinase, spindle pole body (SPB) duplication and spindle checkpoint function [Serendipita sp. 400]|nr:Dual-specificity kinase, spindle pole body (SPB) duplication and spindle checkpoint function [Serendipita sp. 400]
MLMSLVEHDKARSNPSQASTTSHERSPPIDLEYDSDSFDFEAYKRSRYPNTYTEQDVIESENLLERPLSTSSALPGHRGSFNSSEPVERPRASSNTLRTTSSSTTIARTHGSATSGRLKSMLKSVNPRSTGTSSTGRAISHTPGRSTDYLITKGTSKQLGNQFSPSDLSEARESRKSSDSNYKKDATDNISATITPGTSEKQPNVGKSQSHLALDQHATTSSPRSSSASSDDGDISLDDEILANGMAARRHYRLLEERVERLREAFRRDPRNKGLGESDLKQALKSVQLEDPDEQLLYRELWEYVKRDGALGVQWEKYLSRAREDVANAKLRKTSDQGALVDVADGEVNPADDWEDVDPAVLYDGEPRPRSAHQILRSINTDVDPLEGPLSTESYHQEQILSVPQDRLATHLPRDPNNHQAPPLAYRRETESPQIHSTPMLAEDEDEPLPKSRFDKLALNDTLQIRHVQMSQAASSQQEPATLPPSAIIYDPPPPPRSARSHRVSPPTVTPAVARNSVQSSALEKERHLPSRTEERRKQDLSINTQLSSRTKASLTQTKTPSNSRQQINRGTKSGARRKIDDREGGIASGDEPRAQSTSRPNSSRGVRLEDNHRYSQDIQEQSPVQDQGLQGQYASLSRPGTQRQTSYQEAWQASAPGQSYHSLDQLGRVISSGTQFPPYPQAETDAGRHMYANGLSSTSGRMAPNGFRSSVPAAQDGMKNIVTVQVNGQSYQRLEVIGKGGSSKVFRVIRNRDFKQFALKKVELNAVDDESMRGYTEEIRLLKRLSGNKCVVSLIDDELRGKGSGTLYLVLELGETDFAKLLSERQGTPIYLPWITIYFKQMLEAVQVIHDERIVHSDLKPANFVLVRGTLKLIDFGIAKAIANDTTNIQRESQVGTVNYMSPETIDSTPDDEKRRKIGRASDVWSLGCILYQMVYGSPPFASFAFNMKALAITREDHIIPFPEFAIPAIPKERSGTGRPELLEDLKVKVPWELKATMQACLRRDSKTRPTIAELLNESWLNGFYAADDASTVNSNVQRLAEDEAVISTYQITELLNFCMPQLVPSWDGRSVANARKLQLLAEQIMPELQATRADNQYIL